MKERELEVSAAIPVPGDPALAAWLGRVEAKLDRLASALGIPGDAPPGPDDARDVDLSSVGMRFACSESLAAGEEVWVECTVPGRAPRHVRALARVVRSGRADAGSHGWVALDFERIRDRDRDALVRFTQDVQRCATS